MRLLAPASAFDHAALMPPRFSALANGAASSVQAQSASDSIRMRLLPTLTTSERAHARLLAQLGLEPSAPLERVRSRAKKTPAIHPPTSGQAHPFFSKQLLVHGVPIRAHANCQDAALYVAADRVGRMLRSLPPQVHARLRRRGAEVHIVGRRQQVSNLPEHSHLRGRRGEYTSEAENDPRRTVRHGVWAERSDHPRGFKLPLLSPEQLTIDERTRGMGGVSCSCGEENLLCHDVDPRYKGRDVLTHEFAHTLMDFGLAPSTRAAIVHTYHISRSRGLWRRPDGSPAYAASSPEEYWAELTMWFFGSHGEWVDARRRLPAPGPHGLAVYDPSGFRLVGSVYDGSHPTFACASEEVEPLRLVPVSMTLPSGDGTTHVARSASQDGSVAKADRQDDAESTDCTLEVHARGHDAWLTWVDDRGGEHQYGEVRAGGRIVQRTYSGHTWVVSCDAHGTARYVTKPGHAVQTIDISDDLVTGHSGADDGTQT